MTMNTIIAPTDFSAVSRNAVNYAAHLANALNAPLLLLHVVEMPLSVADTPLSAMNLDQLEESAEAEIGRLKEQLLANIGSSLSVTARVVTGSIEQELENICLVKKPFAVIMGSESDNDTSRFLVGRNTLTAVKNLKYPVFVIPPSAMFTAIRHIVLATDLNEVYKLPVDQLSMLLKTLGASLDIIHIAAAEKELAMDVVPATILESRLKALHTKVEFAINKNVVEGIEEFAAGHHDDIILALPKQHLFFAFHKSQAKRLVLHPSLPVLTLPAYLE